MHWGSALRQMFSCLLGMTSPQKATVFSWGSWIPSNAPELATLIITVGTQKIEVISFSCKNSGSRRGKSISTSGISTSLPPQRRLP